MGVRFAALVLVFLMVSGVAGAQGLSGFDLDPLVAPPAAVRQPERQSAPTVRIRSGNHATYGRLVFDFAVPVSPTVTRNGSGYRITFGRPFRADLDGLLRSTRNVGSVRVVRTTPVLAVQVAVRDGVEVRSTRAGTRRVFDFLDPEADPEATDPGAPEAAAPAASDASAAEPSSPASATRPEPTSNAASQTGQAQARQSFPVPPPKPARPNFVAGNEPAASDRQSDENRTPSGADASVAGPPASPVRPAGTVTAVAETSVESTAVRRPAPDQGNAETPNPAIVFEPAGPAAAAIFVRAGALIVVFDQPMALTAGRIVDDPAGLLGPIEPLPVVGGSGFRIGLQPWLRPIAERQGTAWRILGVAESDEQVRVPTVEPQPNFALGPRLLVRAEDAESVIEVVDPAVGDSLFVVPLPSPGEAMAPDRIFPEATLLQTMQGIAVQPQAEGVTVRAVREGIEITAAGGFLMSPPSDIDAGLAATPVAVNERPNLPTDRRRLLDLSGWKRGDLDKFTENRQRLQANIVDVPSDGRNRARLELAQFYIGHGYFVEALGVLRTVLEHEPDLEAWPEFRMMRGAALIGAGRFAEGLADLQVEGLENNIEAGLWRGFAAVEQDNWPLATVGFEAGDAVLAGYPDPHFTRMSLAGTDALLMEDRPDDAARLLDRLVLRREDAEAMPAVQYLRGEMLRQQGDSSAAIALFQQAAEGIDRLYRARAGLALTDTLLEEDRITPAMAAERLARLRFAWRGDYLERDIVRRYGEALWLAGRHAESLNTLRRAASLFPDDPAAASIAGTMTESFAALFEDGARSLPPVEALTLYDQFRELTPIGADGDKIIRELAERLVEIDLLGRAGDLLQHQVEFRLDGEPRAQVGARLAAIRLLDRKPEMALTALDASAAEGLSETLARDRRLLRARALTGLGRSEEALVVLADDDSKPASMLRVDIAWKNRNWKGAEQALARVIGDPPADDGSLAPQAASLVIDRAVALALAGDRPGLDAIRDQFGAAMAETEQAAAFAVLTREDQSIGPFDLETIRNRVAEVDVFQSFLRAFRPGSESERSMPTES